MHARKKNQLFPWHLTAKGDDRVLELNIIFPFPLNETRFELNGEHFCIVLDEHFLFKPPLKNSPVQNFKKRCMPDDAVA